MSPRDTRPISISSAAERVFSRMTLQRRKEKLKLTRSWQCAGTQRQTADYLHAVYRLIETEREWGCGLAVLKVDIAKAFATVRRDKLLLKLREYLGDCGELRVWHTLPVQHFHHAEPTVGGQLFCNQAGDQTGSNRVTSFLLMDRGTDAR